MTTLRTMLGGPARRVTLDPAAASIGTIGERRVQDYSSKTAVRSRTEAVVPTILTGARRATSEGPKDASQL